MVIHPYKYFVQHLRHFLCQPTVELAERLWILTRPESKGFE